MKDIRKMAIKTTIKDGKTFTTIEQLKTWDKNPRSIKEKDFERLKKQITDLGQHTPILVDENGIVYGGNMRLRAYTELGIKDVWISPITGDDDKKLQYALSSNDRAGFYDEDLLANLTGEYPDFNWGDYAVELKEPMSIDDILKSDIDFENIESTEDRQKQFKDLTVTCPKCKESFEIKV